MATTLQGRISDALSKIRHPRTGKDVLTSEAVRDVATTTSGKVRLTLLVSPGDDPVFARTLRQALEQVDGVTEVTIDVGDAAAFAANRKAASRALPVMNQQPASKAAAVPAPTPVSYPNLGSVIAGSS